MKHILGVQILFFQILPLLGLLLELCGKHQVPFFYEPACPRKAAKPLASPHIGRTFANFLRAGTVGHRSNYGNYIRGQGHFS
jgi:hypothetical protein